MAEKPQKPDLKLIHGSGRNEYPESSHVTDEELQAEAVRATLRLAGESDESQSTESDDEPQQSPEPEIDVGPPIVRERYDRIFKPKPTKNK